MFDIVEQPRRGNILAELGEESDSVESARSKCAGVAFAISVCFHARMWKYTERRCQKHSLPGSRSNRTASVRSSQLSRSTIRCDNRTVVIGIQESTAVRRHRTIVDASRQPRAVTVLSVGEEQYSRLPTLRHSKNDERPITGRRSATDRPSSSARPHSSQSV